MKKVIGSALVGALLAVGVFGSLAFIAVSSYITSANYGNRAEKSLEATYENNQNLLGQYTLKVQEIAAVPEMYKNDLKEVVQAAVSGRYGAEGSKATFQWIKEHNPNVDSALYVKIQQVVEAGRNEFQGAQTRLIDEKRVYETNLGYIWTGFWLKLAGYPKVDLSKYKPVVAGDTAKAFETHIQVPIKMRGGN